MSAEWILIPIAIVSFLVVGLVILNIFWLRKKTVASDDFIAKANVLIENKDLESLLDICERTRQSTAKVLARVINFARANPKLDMEAIKQIAESEGNKQSTRLNQPTQLLMDMGVMAPMIGLLGTVVGILRSFGTIASDATPMRTILLAGGVSQALIATALGLSVGLIAMFFYAFFRVRVQNLVTHFENILTELLVKTYHRLEGN
jgi:biopolymer transport protein ExbB